MILSNVSRPVDRRVYSIANMSVVWDLRNAKKPVKTAYNLDIVNPEANVIFSPDEKLILAGTACPKGKGHGQLVFLNRETLEVEQSTSRCMYVSVSWLYTYSLV